eukprot:3560487-Prymnesium_polylepis.1
MRMRGCDGHQERCAADGSRRHRRPTTLAHSRGHARALFSPRAGNFTLADGRWWRPGAVSGATRPC